jgi:membrane protein
MNLIKKQLKKVSKKWVIPNHDGLPVSEVYPIFFKGIYNGSINSRASALSFNFFLALFPAIIFLFTLIAYIPIKDFQEQLLSMIEGLMPKNAYEATRDTIVDIVKHKKGGLLSIGFITAMYFSTNGINALIESFNKTTHVVETRSFIKQRIVAFILTFILSILILSSITLMVFGETTLNYLLKWGILKDKLLFYVLQVAKWIIVLSLFFFGISFLYFMGPSRKMKWRFFSAGSIVATLLCLLVSFGFTYFVNNFGQYNKLYGSIGTLIVILLWIYFNSINLLIGFELNASIDSASKKYKEQLRLKELGSFKKNKIVTNA